MISNDPKVYKAAYQALNPMSGEIRLESEFHALAANDDSCNDAFTWVKVEDLFDEEGFQIDASCKQIAFKLLGILQALVTPF